MNSNTGQSRLCDDGSGTAANAKTRHFWHNERGCCRNRTRGKGARFEKAAAEQGIQKELLIWRPEGGIDFPKDIWQDSAGADLPGGSIPPISTSWYNNTLQCHKPQLPRHPVRFLRSGGSSVHPILSCPGPREKLVRFHRWESCTSHQMNGTDPSPPNQLQNVNFFLLL